MESLLSAGKIPTSRCFDFLRPERREKLVALAAFFVLTGLVSLFGEFFMDSVLVTEADLLAADSGTEIVLSLVQPSPWLAPGLLLAAFTLPALYAETRAVPIGIGAVRPWAPTPFGKVPI